MFKDYLATETDRNHKNHETFTRLLRRACGAEQVVIGHHLTFVINGEPNEIPSADTVIFDFELMSNAFGNVAKPIMLTLCAMPVELRDLQLAKFLDQYPEMLMEGQPFKQPLERA